MRSEILSLALAIPEGLLLGVFFFGGLWWTIQKVIPSKNPGLWFLGSVIFRMGTVLCGFYFVSHVQLSRIFPCLLGFVIGRLAVGYLIKSMSQPTALRGGAIHAPDLR